jgi:hypothetical protein
LSNKWVSSRRGSPEGSSSPATCGELPAGRGMEEVSLWGLLGVPTEGICERGICCLDTSCCLGSTFKSWFCAVACIDRHKTQNTPVSINAERKTVIKIKTQMYEKIQYSRPLGVHASKPCMPRSLPWVYNSMNEVRKLSYYPLVRCRLTNILSTLPPA